ncbi:autotransporter outer membrane beta-barrel domain-containing protein [Parasutterella excrementihominis]|uniref:autotransporter family protein n=3 Tax=Parasutterella excrementihominis TaxID=487175 RepID=UPI00243212F9|nr:autotransporter outer membrane beta-barrel domain-containing protein [Parasutterella excrementihominis]
MKVLLNGSGLDKLIKIGSLSAKAPFIRKHSALAVAACLIFPLNDAMANIEGYDFPFSEAYLIFVDNEQDVTSKSNDPNYVSDRENRPLFFWAKNGSFTLETVALAVYSPSYFQAGGETTFTPLPTNAVQQGQPASLNLPPIALGQSYTNEREPNLFINVIGSRDGDVSFNAKAINAYSGQTDYISFYVDGGNLNNNNQTQLNVASSFNIIDSNVQTSFVVKNSASVSVGAGSTSNSTAQLNFSKENDRFLIENARNVSFAENLSFTNKVKNLAVMGEISDQALIRNSNFSVGKTFLFGGSEYGDVRGTDNAFLQIINDEGVNAEFNVGSLVIQAPSAGNKTSLLVGHGANVKTSSPVIVQAQKEGATAQLLLGDTSSNEGFYNLNAPEVQLKGPGDAKVVFNNGHTGDSAQELRIPIVGNGSVEIQSGRTLFTVPTGYDGQTLIAEQGTLILPTLNSVGQSSIVDNGELVYTGVKGTLQDKISGTGAVSFDKNANVTIQTDTEWTGPTNLRDAIVTLGTSEKPVLMNSSSVNISSESSLSGFGFIKGSLNNEGFLGIGNLDSTETAELRVGKDLNNSGQIVLGNGKSTGNKLIVAGNYSGDNGHILFNTFLGGDNSLTDMLIVEGDTSGRTIVHVNNLGGPGEQTLNGIKLIDVSGKSDGNFVQSTRLAAGAYDYELKRGKGSDSRNWYLISDLTDKTKPDNPNNEDNGGNGGDNGNGGNGDDGKVIPIVRPEAGAYIGNEAVVHSLFTNRLQDRIGDLWFTDPHSDKNETRNFWMRMQGGYTSWKESSGQIKNRTLTAATQLGTELLSFSSNGTNRFQFGWMGGYGHGRTKSHNPYSGYRAIGSVDGLNFGLTGTWFQNGTGREGAYVDTWLTYGWFKNRVKSSGVESYHSKGLTGSLETGYTLKLSEFDTSEERQVGIYFQPQAQVIWSGIKTDNFTESNGTRIEAVGKNNVTTRLGARTIFHLKNQTNPKYEGAQVFIEGNWIHNTKDYGVTMNGVNLKQKGARNLGEFKTGVDSRLNPNLHLWANTAVRAGSYHYRDLSFMAGLKYSF